MRINMTMILFLSFLKCHHSGENLVPKSTGQGEKGEKNWRIYGSLNLLINNLYELSVN